MDQDGPQEAAAKEAELQEKQTRLASLKSLLANIAGHGAAFRVALEKETQELEHSIALDQAPRQGKAPVSRQVAELQVAKAINTWQLAISHREALEADAAAIATLLERARAKEQSAMETRDQRIAARDELRRQDAAEAGAMPGAGLLQPLAEANPNLETSQREIAGLRARIAELEAANNAARDAHVGGAAPLAIEDVKGARKGSSASSAAPAPGTKASAEKAALEVATKATDAFANAFRTAWQSLSPE